MKEFTKFDDRSGEAITYQIIKCDILPTQIKETRIPRLTYEKSKSKRTKIQNLGLQKKR